jgi:hypothetical protein
MPFRPFLHWIIMASSLKAYAPLLASRLGTTPAALYERQRALVRDGILEQLAGRGPGSGVPLAPYPVALLLLAVLATDSLSETADKVRIFATAKPIAEDGRCPLTGKATFVEAMALVLDPVHEHWRNMKNITVHRTSARAVIKYGDGRGSTDSVFEGRVAREAKLQPPTQLLVDAILTRELIIDIAMDLKKTAESQQRARSAALQRTAVSGARIQPRGPRTVRANRRRLKEGKKL